LDAIVSEGRREGRKGRREGCREEGAVNKCTGSKVSEISG